APSNPTSLEAFDRFPSLSLSRWIWKAFLEPSGKTRGSRKHDNPPGACASTRKTSHIGAEQTHLCPVSRYSPAEPPPSIGSARVVLARTSDPPCFSVMALPASRPLFKVAGRSPKS